MLDNRKYPRGRTLQDSGLVNQPGFQAPSKADEYGLWLDEPTEPGAGRHRRGETYGKPTGVLGFRLSNPDFDEAARKKWDGERFYERPELYNDNKLVRPYRVGVSWWVRATSRPTRSIRQRIPESPKWRILPRPSATNTSVREGSSRAMSKKGASL
jgi:hypothetical protein